MIKLKSNKEEEEEEEETRKKEETLNMENFCFKKFSSFTHEELSLIVSVRSRSNRNLEVLVFEERGKPKYPEKNLFTVAFHKIPHRKF